MKENNTKKTLIEHGLAPKKRFGQNFLIHQKTSENIAGAALIAPNDTVIEVGVGLGALTLPLSRKAKRVIGIEVDSGLVRYHRESQILPSNVELIHGDILKTDFSTLFRMSGTKLKIMANLPYSISNPFVFKLIENSNLVDWAMIMLQKEMAERLVANRSTKAYGIPTVLLGACATTSKIMRIKPEQFHPRPKIDSVVVHLDFRKVPGSLAGLPEYDKALFQQVVRTAFAQRRKTLVNNLANGEFLRTDDQKRSKSAAASLLLAVGIQPDSRAENLTIADFIRLTHILQKQQNGTWKEHGVENNQK